MIRCSGTRSWGNRLPGGRNILTMHFTFRTGSSFISGLSGYDGEAYRGVHVRTFAIKDEAAKDKNKRQWSEFWRAIKPGCIPSRSIQCQTVTGPVSSSSWGSGRKGQRRNRKRRSMASVDAGKHIKSMIFKLFQWQKPQMPYPYWSEDRRRFYVEQYGGEDKCRNTSTTSLVKTVIRRIPSFPGSSSNIASGTFLITGHSKFLLKQRGTKCLSPVINACTMEDRTARPEADDPS